MNYSRKKCSLRLEMYLSGFCAIIMLIVFEIVTDPKAQKLWGYYAGVGMMFLEVCPTLKIYHIH